MMGGFGLLSCLVGLVLTLLVLGGLAAVVIWAVQGLGSRGAVAPSTGAAPAASVPRAVSLPGSAPDARVRPNCSQPVQAAWNHCAHCGAPLS